MPQPPDWLSNLPAWFWAGASLVPSAYLGRLTFHTREVRAGRRHFWSADLILDIPTAAGMALLGYGIADYWHLSGPASHAITGVLGYLGPRGVEVLAGWWVRRRQPPEEA
ncbi:MAG: hypothetical protein F8N37_11985 [Telmatospirillum sp.]|nr:hypothetical protein [Telmatospirillum sp.]